MKTRSRFPANNYVYSPRLRHGSAPKGMTLIELITAITILLILSTAAIPIFRNTIVRRRESELRVDLREMRKAIDRYKDMADRNMIASEFGSQGYPKDLDTLVNGVNGSTPDAPRIRFLRRIPVDPMTGKAEWDMQSIDDDPDSQSFGGHGVFDVHSRSQAVGIDGTPYSKMVKGSFPTTSQTFARNPPGREAGITLLGIFFTAIRNTLGRASAYRFAVSHD